MAGNRSILVFARALALVVAFVPGCKPAEEKPRIRAELWSWVVAGWGRHLYLEIKPVPARPELAGRVEFTSAALRRGYQPPADARFGARVCRMTRGVHLRPIVSEPRERIEAEYDLTEEQAERLQRDRVFAAPYVLVGTNSNSGLARVMRDAGLALPDRVAKGGGMLGEFPGIDLDPGPEIDSEQWPAYGLRADK